MTQGNTISLLSLSLLLSATQVVYGQGVLGTNLIVNGGAESGSTGTTTTPVSSIPGWTRAGNANVLPYGLTGYVQTTDPAPPDHGFNYFLGATASSTLTQDIDVSPGASTIGGGNVKYTVSGYFGCRSTGFPVSSSVTVAFKNAGGQIFNSITVGPAGFQGSGTSLQQQIGLVPAGTVRITVTLTLGNQFSVADSLSLVLSTLGTTPGAVLGTNLVVNGNAEAGSGVPDSSTVAYVPGWSTAKGASVAPYGGTNWISTTDPGPADRGVNLFCGHEAGTASYQDIDVSSAATLIDAGQITYEVSGWFGGVAGSTSPTLTYLFYDWAGTQLAATAQLGPFNHSFGSGLVEAAHSGVLPSGTRRVRIQLDFPAAFYTADDINFTLSAPSAPPVITPGGIVSAGAFGGFTSIAPGSWIEIYGTALTSSAPLGWAGSDFNNGVAPTKLSDVSVSVGGQAAFVDFISSGQVNALVPSNTPVGPSLVTLTNSNGTSDHFPIYVNQTQPGLLAPPSFTVSNKQYVAALFSDNTTFAIPTGAISGVASRPAKPGETLTIYGVGFGPVTGGIPAGTIVTQQNSLTTPVQIMFNNTAATLSYYGLAPSLTGLYQFNVVVPNVSPNNALPISVSLGGTKGSQTLYIAVGN